MIKKDNEWGIIFSGVGLVGLFISLIVGANTGNYLLTVISFAVMFTGAYLPDYFKNLKEKQQNNLNEIKNNKKKLTILCLVILIKRN